MERETFTALYGEVGFDLELREPGAQRRADRAEVVQLGGNAVVRGLVEHLSIKRTPVMGNEYDPLQLMDLDQEIQLRACHLVEVAPRLARHQPGRPSGNGPAVVA